MCVRGGRIALATALFSLGACVNHTFAPGPGMSSLDFEPDSARCRLMARGAVKDYEFGASGSPQFVASYTAGAALGAAIGRAIEQNANFNDCMEARGWRVADRAAPATLAPVMVPSPAPSPLALNEAVTAPAPGVARRDLLVRVVPVTPIIFSDLRAPTRGLLILEVGAGGAGASAGLQAGDVILSFNGLTVADIAGMQRELAVLAPGRKVSADIWRDNRTSPIELQF